MQEFKKYVVIVAGGSGSRMGAELPKQFLPIGGFPILMHTIKRWFSFSSDITIITVLPEDQIARWNELCKKYNFSIPHTIVAGGKSRFQSVKNGLNAISNHKEALVAIHDGVRPFINKQIIAASFTTAQTKGNAIVSIELKDSIREIKGTDSYAANRNNFRIIQTPQCFQLSQIKSAFDTTEQNTFTDDASVAEHAGNKIHLIEGSYQNIKITTPEDLALAEAILKVFEF